MQILGIDVGGSGIKGAVVDAATGALTTPRFRVPTPQPATPEAMISVMADIVRHFDWKGPIGVGFPGVIRHGVVQTAANLDESWIGQSVPDLLGAAVSCPVAAVNDADAAGIAEMRFGAGRGVGGAVVVLTLGTGIGSAMFSDGRLYPNSELGQIEMKGGTAEEYAAYRVRGEEELTWEKWGRRLNRYLERLAYYTWPDLIILGGGASKKFAKFAGELQLEVPVVPAGLQNEAGIIGAAMAAMHLDGQEAS